MAETFTVNYNWTKPEIGASIDNWGGFLNGDLDGIDSTVHGIQTTKYDVSNPAGYIADAPNNGTAYARKSAAWAHLTHNDITDWASAAAPPVVISDTSPSSPQPGALWWDSVGGQLYCWIQDANSSQWVIAVNVAAALPPASTTVLGGVKVDGTTIKAAGDGTISTTVVPMGDNRIINGDMRIDARNNGASGGANNVYTIDRWAYYGTQASSRVWGRNLNSLATPPGFPYYLGFVSQLNYTLLATDYFQFAQPIEADAISDFAFGTASAQPVTLSFWAQSNGTGTFSGSIANYASTRSYPFTFSLPTANAWTKIVVTIPGDTAGAWVVSGNSGSLTVHFDLGSGTNSRGAAGAWASANYIGATGAVSISTVNGGAFYVTGVKLEVGSVATPFNRQSLAKSLADCQRYYQVGGEQQSIGANSWQASWTNQRYFPLPVVMRAAPTLTNSGISQINCSSSAVAAVGTNPSILQHTYQITAATGGVASTVFWAASAEL